MKQAVAAVILLISLNKIAKAADKVPAEAKKRAALYQTEVRASMIKHQWHVGGEALGILVVDHTLLNAGASPNGVGVPGGYTRAVIQFKPVSANSTGCKASVLDYKGGYQLVSEVKKYHGSVPSPSDPEAAKTVEKLIDDALVRLKQMHPEYGKATAH